MKSVGEKFQYLGYGLLLIALLDFAIGWIGISLEKNWSLLPPVVIGQKDYVSYIVGIIGIIILKIGNSMSPSTSEEDESN